MLGDRIKAARKQAGLIQEELAKRLGIAYQTLNNYEKGKRTPDAEILRQMANELRCDPAWLLTGEPSLKMPIPSMRHEIHEAPAPYGDHTENFSFVPRYEVQASAGHGEFIHSEQIVDYLAFKSEWVQRELGTSPRNLILIYAVGDSMEPTIHPGDLLLLDRSVDKVKDDSLYVIAIDDALLVKRIQKMFDGKLVVKSDNPAYQQQILGKAELDQLRIIGRLIWMGRRF